METAKSEPVKNDGTMISVSTIYGAKTKEPYVVLEIRNPEMYMSPTQAREIAQMFLEAADAAESDGFVVEFFQKHIGLDTNDATKLLLIFREYRVEQRKR